MAGLRYFLLYSRCSDCSDFLLFRDHKDQIIQVGQNITIKRLMKSLNEYGMHVLFGQVLQKAFATSAEIARHVPTYELHFRKSPDFWKLIDAEFPD